MTGAGTVLVVGGTGHVGTHVVAAVAAAGYEPVTVSRTAGPSDRTVRMDLASAAHGEPERLLARLSPVAVINAAGAVWGRPESRDLEHDNVLLVARLLDALAAVPSPCRARLVQLGTTHEYGPVPPGVRLTAGRPCRPTTGYGRSKLRATRAVLAAARRGGVDATVLRAGNIYGPGTPAASLLGGVAVRLAAAAHARSDAVLELAPLGDHRDFLDVRDVADAIVAACRAPVSGRLLLLGSGTATGVRELVHELVAVSGVRAEIVESRDARGAPERGGGWQEIDAGPARRVLDWAPRHPRRASLEALWQEARRCTRADSSGDPGVFERHGAR